MSFMCCCRRSSSQITPQVSDSQEFTNAAVSPNEVSTQVNTVARSIITPAPSSAYSSETATYIVVQPRTQETATPSHVDVSAFGTPRNISVPVLVDSRQNTPRDNQG